MPVDEVGITRAISDAYMARLRDNLDLDVAVAGAGPSGLIAAADLARAGFKVALFERKLSTGGGIWGGGMLFNIVALQPEAEPIIRELGVAYQTTEDGYLTVDAVLLACVLTARAIEAGATIFNAVTVEDLMVRDGVVTGVVLNWTSVEMAGLHVDPLGVSARATIEATGHDCCLARYAAATGLKLKTSTGQVVGQRAMWADAAEQQTVELSGEVCPGLYVTGMAVGAVHGAPRMGPIFGGMLRSGRRVAEIVRDKLTG